MIWKLRCKTLVSQHIEVALVYKDMLGLDEAINYLEREDVPEEIVQRVLLTDQKRRAATAWQGDPPAAPDAACRRRNLVHHAIVEAALKIDRKLGTPMALTLLQQEQVPDDVAARVIARVPGTLRNTRPG